MIAKSLLGLLATMAVLGIMGCVGNQQENAIQNQPRQQAAAQLEYEEETAASEETQYEETTTASEETQYEETVASEETQYEETTVSGGFTEPWDVPEYQVSDEIELEEAGQPVKQIAVTTSSTSEEELQSIAEDLGSKNPDMGALSITFVAEPVELEDPALQPIGTAMVFNDTGLAQSVAETVPVPEEERLSPQEVEALVEENNGVADVTPPEELVPEQ